MAKKSKLVTLGVGLAAVVYGLMVVGLGYVCCDRLQRSWHIASAGKVVQGKVVDFVLHQQSEVGLTEMEKAERDRKSGEHAWYHLQVEFEDNAHAKHRFESFKSVDDSDHQIGERIKVRYWPKDPSQAAIDRFVEIWGDSLLWSGVDLALALLGAGVWWVVRINARLEREAAAKKLGRAA